jgi:hypothetical protein
MNKGSGLVSDSRRKSSDMQPTTRTQYLVLSTEYRVLHSLLTSAWILSRWLNFALAAITLSGLFAAAAANAQEPPRSDAVQSAKEALTSGARFPWYDRRQDDVRRLNIVPRESANNRGDKWTATNTPATPVTTAPARTNFSLFGTLLQWIGLTVLIVLLGIIAFLIASAFLKEEVSESVTVRKVVESRRDADRVEALPFHIRAASGNFLAEARRLYEAGQFSEAIVYLFSHELVQLDKHHVIRLTRGKTNRQYVRETRQRPALRAILETTMIAFEDAFFGKKILSREAFESCWQRLDEFQGELDRQERAAA